MAQMAPTPGRPVMPATPDVFSERTHALANRIVPVGLGLVYGYWAAAMNRDAGPITGWNVLFGLVTAFVFAALHIAVLTVAPRLRRELHAALWAAFAGCAFGFLYSQASQHSVLRSVAMSLAVAAGFLVVNFYRYYTHEDATGHRLR
ncbi:MULTISPECIES: hypothetical protein [Streptomyces]|uniref:hypothetical protein n=1 Tax=Streptomyces scabiei TaxID=1930 RepID=UPI000765853F|nr:MULTISPECIES: hypothetical protein [Streptomyces]MBP5868544.1 hypothetical protein [Streptomyces sp. LBUM 1485]MBP5892349.1 hypothetical protein [Streptomyces sp. LBUM 1481]MBP5915532.1 hypothetical protein [Streptomyces sp. LBUM 1486]MBP5922583.1 hypothetical protein [Streptomyces sp. LBUM 1483]MDX2691400.1 hypothetical protein [Streptomyces scabiei]